MSIPTHILSVLEEYEREHDVDAVARNMADDFRRRRLEKNISRAQVAQRSGVAVANIVRFEQTGQISLKNLIGLAMALGYTTELQHVFAEQKYATMDELLQIRSNLNRKKSHPKS
jgi:transcriptional regulator with XRE-family HTH domain